MKKPKGTAKASRHRRGDKQVGTFKQCVELAARPEGLFVTVEALVDTGSVYTWAPGHMLRELGLDPSERLEFVMANGERIKRDAAEVLVRLGERLRHTVCVFGDDSDQVLLGAYTLEGFALAVDPIGRRLVPMETIPAAEGTN